MKRINQAFYFLQVICVINSSGDALVRWNVSLQYMAVEAILRALTIAAAYFDTRVSLDWTGLIVKMHADSSHSADNLIKHWLQSLIWQKLLYQRMTDCQLLYLHQGESMKLLSVAIRRNSCYGRRSCVLVSDYNRYIGMACLGREGRH